MNNKLLTLVWKTLWITFAFCSILTPQTIVAQTSPVNFLCVNAGTLEWEYVHDDCGPFVSYDVFFSSTQSGPFSLLTGINNLAQTSFLHDNPSNEVRYYYITSNFNCPGQSPTPSDTLDNQLPEIARLKAVSVENGLVNVSWYASPSPETAAYIIYRKTPLGTLPIDTVSADNLNYIDTGASPADQSEEYFILALDACNNNSIFDVPHQSVLMEANVQNCDPNIYLFWQPYPHWDSGVDSQEVWLSIDGEAEFLLDSLSATDSSYVYPLGNDGIEYCFRIIAYENGNPVSASSNQRCMMLSIVQPMRDLLLYNVSYNSNNEAEVGWVWDNSAELKTENISRSPDNVDYGLISSTPATNALIYSNVFTDNTPEAGSQAFYYTVQSVDQCDAVVNSNYGKGIFLSGNPQTNYVNQLSWTPLEIEAPLNILRYELYALSGNGERFVASFDNNMFNFSESVDPFESDNEVICYYVQASSEIELPDGRIQQTISRSNLLCLEQFAGIQVPNAFVPDGKNKEFRPLVVFGKTASYSLEIFDRWGKKIFESTDIYRGWDGRSNGKELQQDTYVYNIKLRQSSGREIEKSGVLLLIR